ncbi:MAG TPA: tryptophan synthase subunit alpha [Acidimicrobiales bacterium]
MSANGVGVETALRASRDRGRKLLVPYVTGGLGSDWVDVLRAMVAAGADAVEVGIPFSDPVMDGPTIQEASQRSLQLGTTPPGIIHELHNVDVAVPLIAMTYYNLVFRGGHRRIAHSLADAGVRGAIIPDIPLEELDEWWPAAEDAGVETVLLAAPVTPDERLAQICQRSKGFVYGVNVMGVTGERTTLGEAASVLAKRLKAITDKPVVMGFGVSTPEQAAEVAAVADGVVVASALMRLVLDGGGPDAVGELVSRMREALDAG